MPITAKMFPGLIEAASKEGTSAFEQGSENARQNQMVSLKKYLQGQKEGSVGEDGTLTPGTDTLSAERAQQTGMKSAQDLYHKVKGQGGGGVSLSPTGGVSITTKEFNPYQHAAAQGGQFNKIASQEYKPINEQLSASRGTLDALNQKNGASDKLALINEARLAAGSGGSRALKGVMDALSGGKTAGMDYQTALNYVNNTPDVPTMQEGQRDAIRESVFSRLPHLEQQHQQAAAKLSQLGPSTAPYADYTSIANSYVNPAGTNLSQLKQMQAEYTKARQGQRATSNPSQADAAPSTLDRLKSFLGGGSSQPQGQEQPKGAMSFEDWKKANGR